MDIIESQEVHQQELAILAQGSPQKAKNSEKVTSGLHGANIYETKNQQMLSFSAKNAIRQVQQKMQMDKALKNTPGTKRSKLPIRGNGMMGVEGILEDNDGLEDDDETGDDEAGEQSKLARKLLMAGAGPSTGSRQTKSYVDEEELILDSRQRERQLLAHDPASEESAAIAERIAMKLAPNVQTLYRLNVLNQMQTLEIQDSLRLDGPPRQKLDLEELDDEERDARNHIQRGHDDALSIKQAEYIDLTEAYWKRMKQMEKLVSPIAAVQHGVSDNKLDSRMVDADLMQNSFEATSHEAEPTIYNQNLLNEIDAHDKFYHKAKQEVTGNN